MRGVFCLLLGLSCFGYSFAQVTSAVPDSGGDPCQGIGPRVAFLGLFRDAQLAAMKKMRIGSTATYRISEDNGVRTEFFTETWRVVSIDADKALVQAQVQRRYDDGRQVSRDEVNAFKVIERFAISPNPATEACSYPYLYAHKFKHGRAVVGKATVATLFREQYSFPTASYQESVAMVPFGKVSSQLRLEDVASKRRSVRSETLIDFSF